MSSLDTLIENLRNQLVNESAAAAEYNNLGAVAHNLGFVSDGNVLADIASGEESHRESLAAMIERLIEARRTTPEHRPFPKTYGDWAELGADIKETDPSTSEEVNNALIDIAGDLPGCLDAKRWLTSKAGELGIA